MELKNPLYKNIGVHVITSIFTVEKGVTKEKDKVLNDIILALEEASNKSLGN